MANKKKRSNLSPILSRAKFLLLVMSVILIVANLYLLSATRHLADSYSARQNQATWFLFQLTKEFSELSAIVPFSAKSEAYRNQTLLKYELTWSRFDLLLNSREADTFIRLPGAKTFFETLFNNFKQLEHELELLEQPYYADNVSKRVSSLYMAMIQYINTNFRIQSPLYREQMKQAEMLHSAQIALLVLLAISASLAGYIIHLEAKHHRVLSLTDSLTKIRNRLALFNDLNKHLLEQKPFTIYLLDLNGFKQINDKHGHQAGDKALKEIAKRLSTVGLPCYRIGGDEFALIEFKGASRDMVCAQINHCFIERIQIDREQFATLATSIGVASYPKDALQISQLISIADGEMYRMKFGSKNDASFTQRKPVS
tara:strand:- start:2641 stop:3753 length:1113 start_codon:yes stop_codon:yes gene_type:complete